MEIALHVLQQVNVIQTIVLQAHAQYAVRIANA